MGQLPTRRLLLTAGPKPYGALLISPASGPVPAPPPMGETWSHTSGHEPADNRPQIDQLEGVRGRPVRRRIWPISGPSGLSTGAPLGSLTLSTTACFCLIAGPAE